MVNFEPKPTYNVEDLRQIVALLRAPGGCPWDGAQTHESLRRNFIEEAYEVAEAIDEASPAHLKEELGDVLLQVLFHASIEEDAGRFNLDEVADGICKKLIFRHPHVFGQGGEGTPDSWEALKRQEKGQTTETETLQAVAEDSNIEEELGDLLFAAVKVARFFHIDAEEALAGTCEKFIRRFSGVEAAVTAQGRTMHDLDVAQLMALWNREKHPEQREKKTREGKHQ